MKGLGLKLIDLELFAIEFRVLLQTAFLGCGEENISENCFEYLFRQTEVCMAARWRWNFDALFFNHNAPDVGSGGRVFSQNPCNYGENPFDLI